MSTATMEPQYDVSDMPDGIKVQDVKLDNDIYLVDIVKHRWSGEHVLPPEAKAKVEVDGQEVKPKLVKKSSACLIPKSLQGVLAPGYSRVDTVLARFTVNFSGAKAVAGPAKNQFFAELKQARAFLAECVAEFVSRYEAEVVDYNQAEWGPTLKENYGAVIGKLIPAASHVGERFRYSVRNVRRLEAPSEEYKSIVKLDKELLAEVRANKREDYEAAMDELVAGPRNALAEALDGLVKQLQDGKILQRASFNAVLDAIALNRAFAGTITDAKLLDTAKALEQAIDTAIVDAETNKTSSMSWSDLLSAHKGDLTAAIAPVAEAAKDSAAVEQVRRRLNVRVRPVDV
jgi:Protein of unknown function (DUF3150)